MIWGVAGIDFLSIDSSVGWRGEWQGMRAREDGVLGKRETGTIFAATCLPVHVKNATRVLELAVAGRFKSNTLEMCSEGAVG
jgi:hypothetical protein